MYEGKGQLFQHGQKVADVRYSIQINIQYGNAATLTEARNVSEVSRSTSGYITYSESAYFAIHDAWVVAPSDDYELVMDDGRRCSIFMRGSPAASKTTIDVSGLI